jgi:choline dehydrogenase-like flavoprotein
VLAPLEGSDETLEAFVPENLTQGFHAMSTCIMGRSSHPNKVVGNNFTVEGIEGLRVADMSVCPILTSNHTQINACLIGERCVDFVLSSDCGFPEKPKL